MRRLRSWSGSRRSRARESTAKSTFIRKTHMIWKTFFRVFAGRSQMPYSPTRLALGFLQSGREIGSGYSSARFPRHRATGSPACGEPVPPAPVPSSPSIEPVPQAYEPQFPKPQDFWKKIALAILDERPRIFQKMTLAVWCGLYVVIIWFDGLPVWIYAVLWFLYGFMCFLYGVMWFTCGLM